MKPSFSSVISLAAGLAVLLVCASPGRAAAASGAEPPYLVPWPRMLSTSPGSMPLAASGRIIAAEPQLLPLAGILSDEIFAAHALRLTAAAGGTPRTGDIILRLGKDLRREDHTLRIGTQAVVQGANYNAVAMGTVTLLQAIRNRQGQLSLPLLTITDGPALEYCGTMLDIARKPYSIETLKRCVDAARFYKIRYIHLHMSDENAWTFPSTKFPQLGTTNFAWAGGEKPVVYQIDELKALVAYGDARGVTFVPELETPGHSGALRGSLPEIFGYKDDAGKIAGAGIINIVSEEAYAALDTLIGEAAAIFKSSPFIHIGCDECSPAGTENFPEVKALVAREKLPYPHAIFSYYVNRMNGIVKKHGKRMIVWEGAPLDPIAPPKEVIFMPWVGGAGAAAELVKRGYSVINAPWGVDKPYMDVYKVNGAQLAHGEPLLFGATSILWEAVSEKALPYIRYSGALRNEPTYNPDSGKTYEDFLARQQVTERLLDRVLYGFGFERLGLLDPGVNLTVAPIFDKAVKLGLFSSYPQGNVRYTLDGTEPAMGSPVLKTPLVLTATTTLKARWFSADGKDTSPIYSQEFLKLQSVTSEAVGAKVTMTPPQPGYFGPGPKGLTDGLLAAGNTYTAAGWVGWNGPGVITLDLGKSKKLASLTAHFLRSGGGVDLPKTVEFQTSSNGRDFTAITTVDYAAGSKQRGWFSVAPEKAAARYLRLNITANGEWTFLDEIAVNGAIPGPDTTHEALGKPVTFATGPNGYVMPGAQGMTDGYLSREGNFLSPEWLGWEGRNLEATVDLGRTTEIREVAGHFCQHIWAGIRIPEKTDVLVSDDGKEFRKVETMIYPKNEIGENTAVVATKLKEVKARYVRILAYTNGQWLFLDEIMINPAAKSAS